MVSAIRTDLTVHDHTVIMEMLIRHHLELRQRAAMPASALLRVAGDVIPGKRFTALMETAAANVDDLFAGPELLDRQLAHWDQGRAALGAMFVARAEGHLRETVGRLAKDAPSEPLRIGLETAAAILDDGAQTIYNPEFWIVEQQIAPEPLNSMFEQMWMDALLKFDETVNLVGDIALADAGGAVVGAVKGALTGGTAGAEKGAVSGAVAGSVKAATGGSGTAE